MKKELILLPLVLLTGCNNPQPSTESKGPSTVEREADSKTREWISAGTLKNDAIPGGVNVYSLNRSDGRVCEYTFFNMTVPVKDSPATGYDVRSVEVTCSKANETE